MREIPYGYCHCGCGQKTSIAYKTRKEFGWVKGEPLPYIKYHPRVSVAERFWAKVAKTDNSDDCWEWQASLGSYGYGQILVFNNGKRRPMSSHRFAWIDTYGTIPDGLFVCHRCDNPKCVNPSHLFLGTQLDNIRDMRKKGRAPLGEKHGRHKLMEGQVQYIREQYTQGGITQRELAERVGISVMQINRIINNKDWQKPVHVVDESDFIGAV